MSTAVPTQKEVKAAARAVENHRLAVAAETFLQSVNHEMIMDQANLDAIAQQLPNVGVADISVVNEGTFSQAYLLAKKAGTIRLITATVDKRCAQERLSQRIHEFVHLATECQKFVLGHLGQAIPEGVDCFGFAKPDASEFSHGNFDFRYSFATIISKES